VLGSWPLRSIANQMAYYDTDSLATDDAIRVGLLHCLRSGWEDDSIAWLLGGGYSVSSQVRLNPDPDPIPNPNPDPDPDPNPNPNPNRNRNLRR
jgi:hypothetical protein